MFSSLFRLLSGGRRPASPPKNKNRVLPSLEALEERWVPTTVGSGLSQQMLIGDNYSTFNTPPIAISTPNTASTSSTPSTTPAATQTQQVTAAFTSFKTGGSQTQSVAQFDPSLGTLTSVQIILNGTLNSDVQVENLDAAPSTVNAQVNGNLALQGPGGSQLLSVAPTITENSTSLSAYDGTLDYGGTSGHDFGEQSASAHNTITLTNNLAAWQGSGHVALTEAAQSSSTVSGSGNEQVHICSEGSGTVTVIYNYTPKPATPSTPPPVTPPCDNPPPSTPSTPPPVTPPTTPPPTTPSTPPPVTPPCNNPPPTTPSTPPPVTPPPTTPSTPPPTTTCTPPTGPASIEGIVYVDANHSGHYDQSEAGANHVTVTLHGVTLTQQQVTETVTTGTNGTYQFTNLQAGVYTLSDQPIPSQYTAGAATLGSLGGVVSNGQLILALPQGGDGMCYDFGLVPTPPPTVPPNSPPPVSPPPCMSPPPPTVPPHSPPPVTPPPTVPPNVPPPITPPPVVPPLSPPPVSPPPATPPSDPPVQPPYDPPLPPAPPPALSKRSLIGDGWQSLG